MGEQNQDSGLKHRIWVKAVGIELAPQKKQDGTYFWTYRFARAYEQQGSWKYTDTFTSYNDEALNQAIVEMIRFREATDPTRWVAERMEQVNQENAA